MIIKMKPLYNWLIFLMLVVTGALGNKPVFDLANNMRVVLLPSDTKTGTIIYKLRASDADEDYPLTFRAFGKDSSMIDILNVDCTQMICEADVVLMKPLFFSKRKYNLNLEVKDTRGEATVVETEIQVTQNQKAFIGAPRILEVPEDTSPKTLLESFTIMENPNLFRGIRCRLLPTSARKYFELHQGLQTAIKGESRCDLRLIKGLDYESRASFVLQIVAENAWTNSNFDTRNVAVHEFIVEVLDVPDTAPYFLSAPPVTVLPETAKEGHEVMQVRAFDGDYAHPRRIRYGLDPEGLPYSSFFQIHPDTGTITVRKGLEELERRPANPVVLRIIAEELPTEEEIASVRPSELAKTLAHQEVEVAIIIDDVIDRKPKFLQDHYITSLKENAIEGTQLAFEGGLNVVEDLDKGENGMLELYLDDFNDVFEVSPTVIENSGQFSISVKNNKRLDFEKLKNMEFRIVARELGANKLTATALVTVRLIDENDNEPRFERDKYFVQVHENEAAGTPLLQVKATDLDSGDHGKIKFTRLIGDDPIVSGLKLDSKTGEITIISNEHLDREKSERHIIGVEAVDMSGDGTRSPKTAEATIEIEVLDVNDVAPMFLKKKYQGFMNKDLTNLRNDLQVEASDKDRPGSKNSQIRYEIINGNYEKKFAIDEFTGEIFVREPLTPTNLRSNTGTERKRASSLDPVITLIVRAYDLGIPSLDAEVPVHIFTEEVSSRTMRFIVPRSPEEVAQNEAEISDLISAMTGGEVDIQDIQPFFGRNGGEFSGQDITEIDLDRSSKTVSSKANKSVIDVFIRYPPNSVVDMNTVTSKLIANQTGSAVNKGSRGNDGTAVEVLEQRNAALFWGLIALCLLIALVVLIILCCCCCPGCYFNNEKNSVGIGSGRVSSEREIQVLTVKDGQGKEIKDARFVEIFKSARQRMKSAASIGRSSGFKRWRLRSEDGSRHVDPYGREGPKRSYENRAFKARGDEDSVIFVREANGKRTRRRPQNVTTIEDEESYLRELEELDVRNLDSQDGFSTSRDRHGRSRVPSDTQKIFKVISPEERNSSRQGGEDLQIWRLDDETRRGETFQKIGGSEILSLDAGVGTDFPPEVSVAHKASQSLNINPNGMESPHLTQTDGALEGNKKSYSEMDVSKLGDLDPGGEFYTAIGPDGKEIILRRYLNDQLPDHHSDGYSERGFLSMAMFHLQTQRHQNEIGTLTDHSPSPARVPSWPIYEPKKLRHNSNQTENFVYGPSPKHYIRTPILEETDSGLDRELTEAHNRLSRRDRYTISYDNSDASVLRFRLNDGSISPEPAYVETKASILRRRNTMAKLLLEEDKAFKEEKKNRIRNWSLNDLHRRARNYELTKDAKMRRWNSLSNDELTGRYNNHHHYYQKHLPHPSHTRHVHYQDHVENQISPRKFSVHNSDGHHQVDGPNSQVDVVRYGREPMWSRITNSFKRAYYGRNGQQYQPERPTFGMRRQHYVYPDQQSTASDSSSDMMPSRSSSEVSLHRRKNLTKMVEAGQNSKEAVDKSFNKNIRHTPDMQQTESRSYLNVPHDHAYPSSKTSSPQRNRKTKKKSHVTPRYMEWYENSKANESFLRNQLDPHRDVRLSRESLRHHKHLSSDLADTTDHSGMAKVETEASAPQEVSSDPAKSEQIKTVNPATESVNNTNKSIVHVSPKGSDEDGESGISSLSQNQNRKTNVSLGDTNTPDLITTKLNPNTALPIYPDLSAAAIRPNSAEVLVD